MRTGKNITLVLGIVLIVMNLLSFASGNSPILTDPNVDAGTKIGYFIGSFILMGVGVILVLISRSYSRRLKERKENESVDSLFKDSDHSKS